MQFTRENAERVMAGRKTQTRRPNGAAITWIQLCPDDEPSLIWFYPKGDYINAHAVYTSSQYSDLAYARRKWQVGKDYAVQPGRGKHAIGRIRIKNIRFGHVGDISEADAIAEGFEDVQGFIDIWTRLYGAWTPEQPVWVLDFELVSGEAG